MREVTAGFTPSPNPPKSWAKLAQITHSESSGDAAYPGWLPKACCHPQIPLAMAMSNVIPGIMTVPTSRIPSQQHSRSQGCCDTLFKWPLNKGFQHKPPPFLPAQLYLQHLQPEQLPAYPNHKFQGWLCTSTSAWEAERGRGAKSWWTANSWDGAAFPSCLVSYFARENPTWQVQVCQKSRATLQTQAADTRETSKAVGKKKKKSANPAPSLQFVTRCSGMGDYERWVFISDCESFLISSIPWCV